METLWNAVRSKVSADKNRFMKGHYDLDLTYITDRIIAMAFPADGLEGTYRNNVNDVAQMLREHHSQHFVIYNLSERSYDYRKFEDQVYEWCGFPDHHAPPLSKLFLIVRSMYSWLVADRGNIVVVHCLAGKGRTGTVIAAFLLYSGLFNSGEKALSYFAMKRSTNNWGVTGPSQIRYVNYFADILYKNEVPSTKPLRLSYLHMSSAPSFNGIGTLALGRQAGCSPFIHIYNTSDGKRLVYSSEVEGEDPKSFVAGQPIQFQIDCTLKGDILIEIYHVTSFYKTEHMLRFEFHTGMIRSAIVRFPRADIDLACGDKRFPASFFIDLGFETVKEVEKEEGRNPKGDGSICFHDETRLLLAKELSKTDKGKLEKAGWLTKRGHKVKNWKRRWFLLKDPTLCYFKSPRDTIPAGIIILDDILTVVSEKNIYQDKSTPSEKPNQYWFEIITKKNSYLICSENEQEMRDWVDAIEFVISQNEKMRSDLAKSPHGSYDDTLLIHPLAAPKLAPPKSLSTSMKISRASEMKKRHSLDFIGPNSLPNDINMARHDSLDSTNDSLDFEQIQDSMKSIDQDLNSIETDTKTSNNSDDEYEIVNSCHKAKDQGGFILKSNTSIGDFVLMRNNEQ